MGLARGAVMFLLEESRRRPLEGTALTLGRQDVWLTWEELEAAASDIGVELSDPGTISLARKPAFAQRGRISDDTLFRALGLEGVEALDASDFEAADHVLDLNSSTTPEALRERFQLIVDGGTLEHVFHIPNALANLHRLLAPGGRIVHFSPSSNHIDHGFWMFSPTLFRDYYLANGYSIERLQVFRHTPHSAEDPWLVFDYGTEGRPFDHLSYGGLDDAMYGICCIATKSAEAVSGEIPQQGAYVAAWAGGPAAGGGGGRRRSPIEWLDLKAPAAARAARRLGPIRVRLRHLGARLRPRKRLGIKPTARY